MLITIRPGLVLHVWRDGEQVAAVPLISSAALNLSRDLLTAIAELLPKSQTPSTTNSTRKPS